MTPGCVPAPCGADARAVAADRDSPSSAPRSSGNDPPAAGAESIAHPGDPSSACVPASSGSRPHPRSTTRTAAPTAIARTNERAHSPPSPRALCALRSEIAVERLCFLTVLQSPFLELPSIRIHKCNLLKPRMVIRSYNDHCSAPFSRALVGWHHQSLIGYRSRHCYGINYTHNPNSKQPRSTYSEASSPRLGDQNVHRSQCGMRESSPLLPA